MAMSLNDAIWIECVVLSSEAGKRDFRSLQSLDLSRALRYMGPGVMGPSGCGSLGSWTSRAIDRMRTQSRSV